MCYGCLLAKRYGLLTFAYNMADGRAANMSKVADVCNQRVKYIANVS